MHKTFKNENYDLNSVNVYNIWSDKVHDLEKNRIFVYNMVEIYMTESRFIFLIKEYASPTFLTKYNHLW